ncbi:hypothetical protein AYI70_g11072, partial [Smittium culicis]
MSVPKAFSPVPSNSLNSSHKSKRASISNYQFLPSTSTRSNVRSAFQPNDNYNPHYLLQLVPNSSVPNIAAPQPRNPCSLKRTLTSVNPLLYNNPSSSNLPPSPPSAPILLTRSTSLIGT